MSRGTSIQTIKNKRRSASTKQNAKIQKKRFKHKQYKTQKQLKYRNAKHTQKSKNTKQLKIKSHTIEHKAKYESKKHTSIEKYREYKHTKTKIQTCEDTKQLKINLQKPNTTRIYKTTKMQNTINTKKYKNTEMQNHTNIGNRARIQNT